MRINFSIKLKSVLSIIRGVMDVVRRDFSLKLFLALSLVLIAIAISLNVVVPFLFRDLIHHLRLDASSGLYTSLMLVLFYTGCWSLRQITVQLREIFCFPVIERLLNVMTFNLFKNVLESSVEKYSKVKIEKIIDNVIRTQEIFSDLFVGLFLYVIPTILEILVILCVVGTYFPFLFCCIFGFFIFCHICFTVWGLGKTSFLQKRYIEARNIFQSFLVDKLLNFETIKIFAQESKEEDISQKYLKRYENFKVKADVTIESVRLGQGLILGLLVISSTIAGTIYVKSHQISVENLVLLNFYFVQLIAPLGLLGIALKNIKRGIVHVGEMFSFMKASENETTKIEEDNSILMGDMSLIFDDVSFAIGDKKILKDISFNIVGNGILGVIGKTGSGKSTLAKLLVKLFDPTKGSITLNGKKTQELLEKNLRRNIGYVAQHPTFFNDSILNNLLYGNPSVSKKEIEKVIEKVCLTDVIEELPEKYHTLIGKNGVTLSGGQAQLLALARVLLMNPCLYVFDEITSALDSKTQEKIVEILDDLSQNALIIVISHRMSLIRNAKKVITLSNGVLVQDDRLNAEHD